MTKSTKLLLRNATIATLGADAPDYGLMDDGAMIVEAGRISWLGPQKTLPKNFSPDEEHDLGHRLLTPGLVDCHTHLVYGGNRAQEFELRLHGATYEQLAQQGHGIQSTVRATRAATAESLLSSAVARAVELAGHGVTTVEIKSGYGLDFHHERLCLKVARQVGEQTGLTTRVTCLAAHTLPGDFQGNKDDYIQQVCQWLPQFKDEGLVDAVDAFVEKIAFSPTQIASLFRTSRTLGLPVKVHAEQLSNQGGAQMASTFAALSCDHLEYLDAVGISAMARAGTVAVMLPGAFYFIRETQPPPIGALRQAGVPMALASDHNPGTSPILSPMLVMNMAATLFRMTPEECLKGYTTHAARALGLVDRGHLAAGMRADIAVWDVDHPNELCYWMGKAMNYATYIAGEKRASGTQ